MNVLILDNQSDHIETLARGLRINGHCAFPATSAQEAMAYLRESDPTVDLIITDDATVLQDSEELIRWIREGNKGTPVIMMTRGEPVFHNVNPLCDLCTIFLQKPFDVSALMQTLQNCIQADSWSDHGSSP